MIKSFLSLAPEHLFPNKVILTPSEVAEGLRVDERTVRRWLDEGHLDGFKVGRQWRIPLKNAIAFAGTRP